MFPDSTPRLHPQLLLPTQLHLWRHRVSTHMIQIFYPFLETIILPNIGEMYLLTPPTTYWGYLDVFIVLVLSARKRPAHLLVYKQWLRITHANTQACMYCMLTSLLQVGYPNVGKSSTINTLFQGKKVPVSATPGRTKHFQVSREIGMVPCISQQIWFSKLHVTSFSRPRSPHIWTSRPRAKRAAGW